MERINTKEKFEEVIMGEEPIIVKFFADWCPDCTRMNMFIDQVLAEYGNYKWYELNNDEVPDVAAEQDVMGIPSILLFQNGEKLAHLHSANAKSPEEVIAFLQQQLG